MDLRGPLKSQQFRRVHRSTSYQLFKTNSTFVNCRDHDGRKNKCPGESKHAVSPRDEHSSAFGEREILPNMAPAGLVVQVFPKIQAPRIE